MIDFCHYQFSSRLFRADYAIADGKDIRSAARCDAAILRAYDEIAHITYSDILAFRIAGLIYRNNDGHFAAADANGDGN
jgi:hypothetical protein